MNWVNAIMYTIGFGIFYLIGFNNGEKKAIKDILRETNEVIRKARDADE